MVKYRKEHLDWLKENYPSMSRREIAESFNREFNLSRSYNSVIACLKNHKIKSGRTGSFKKGQTAWNLGLKGYMGRNITSFKKGRVPHNQRPLWSERIDSDGYVKLSIPAKNRNTGFATRYKNKHVWIWEQENGPVPTGHVVIFKDGDNRNFEKDNLVLVTRRELLSLNQHGYKQHPEELKPSVLALAKLEAEGGFMTCPGRGRKNKPIK